jgi:biopolymer transport protein ExbD
MKSSRTKREDLTPEITPLIDIIFLLLIFFMVTSVFKDDEVALMLALPKSSSPEVHDSSIKSIEIILNINELAYNGEKVDFTELNKQLAEQGNKLIAIDLRIDKKVTYERVTEVLDLLQKYDLTNLNLVMDPK